RGGPLLPLAPRGGERPEVHVDHRRPIPRLRARSREYAALLGMGWPCRYRGRTPRHLYAQRVSRGWTHIPPAQCRGVPHLWRQERRQRVLLGNRRDRSGADAARVERAGARGRWDSLRRDLLRPQLGVRSGYGWRRLLLGA